MAKKRTLDIDKLLFDTDIITMLTPKGILMYQMMWGHADDWGGIELNSKALSLRMGALKTTIPEIEKEIEKLINKLKKIIPYEIAGKRYGWIKNFLKHQRLNNPSLPTIPIPEWIHYTTETYPSGKKYANYTVITGKLPVDYQYTTSSIAVKAIRYDTKRNDTVAELLEYYCQTTNQKIAFTKTRRELVHKRLDEEFTPEQIKQAMDNFSKDDWPDRHKFMDLRYCIGTKDGINLLEKWLNCKSQGIDNAPKRRSL